VSNPELDTSIPAETSMISIRNATSSDIPAIQTLYRELDRHHVDLLPDTFRPVEGDVRSDESIAEWIVAEDRVYLVAESDGNIVGFVSVAIKSRASLPMFHPKRYGLIDDVVLTTTHRRTGLGKKLFNAALDWIHARGLQSVQVQVWNANSEAVEFYSRQGFSSICTRMELNLND
jgi:ribosomal protein S18 acetylase RimI-like enzyme